MSIKVLGFQWKKQMLITGHYKFEILIPNKYERERTIYRRFSEIVWLHDGLIKNNPGCLIPPLPDKSFKFNLNVNNQIELDTRVKQIEEMLNYINIHNYLSKNEYFIKFLSDDFSLKNIENPTTKTESFKVIENEDNTPKQSSIMGKMIGFTSYIPNFLMGSKQKKGLSQIDDDMEMNIERENFLRMYTGVKDLIENIRIHLDINEKSLKTIGDFIETNKTMNFTSLNYKYANNNEDNQDSENKRMKKNMDILFEYYEENRNYQNNYLKDIVKELNEFLSQVNGIIEIFERKKIQDEEFDKLKKNFPKGTEVITKKKEFIDNFREQMKFEIDNFKREKADKLVMILNKFYQGKYDSLERLTELFNNQSSK